MKEFEKNIRRVEPYVPGEQPQTKVIKLNTNENPYPPAPGVLGAMKEMETQIDSLRLYPDPTSDSLVSALADYYQVGKDQVFVGSVMKTIVSLPNGEEVKVNMHPMARPIEKGTLVNIYWDLDKAVVMHTTEDNVYDLIEDSLLMGNPGGKTNEE